MIGRGQLQGWRAGGSPAPATSLLRSYNFVTFSGDIGVNTDVLIQTVRRAIFRIDSFWGGDNINVEWFEMHTPHVSFYLWG